MSDLYNGMPAGEIEDATWRKPWSGSNGGCCVEAAKLPGGRVAIRQSTDPQGPALIFEPAEIQAFLAGVQEGLADFLL
jgi:Domain of unknown function (DUF397)